MLRTQRAPRLRTAHHRTGTRPGGPLADLVFAFMLSRLMRGLTSALCDAKLLPRIWVSGRVGEEPEAGKLVPQAFMYDLVTGRLSGSYPKALFCSGDVQEGVCGSGPAHDFEREKTEAMHPKPLG